MLQDFTSSNSSSPGAEALYVILSIFAGVALALQAALNKKMVGNPLRSSVVSFSVRTLVLFVAFGVTLSWTPFEFNRSAMDWWDWFPGVLSVIYILSSILVAPHLGMSLFFVLIVAGQTRHHQGTRG